MTALTETDRNILGTLARVEGGASPVAWAIGTISVSHRYGRLTATERTVLLAVASLAAFDLCSGNGYQGVTARRVAEFTALNEDRVRGNLIRLANDRGLVRITDVQGPTFIYRLPERALNLESTPAF